MTQPARLTFWRILLAAVSLLALFSAGQLLALAARLGTAPLTSKSWLAALGVLALVGLGSLLLLGLTWSPSRPALLDRLE